MINENQPNISTSSSGGKKEVKIQAFHLIPVDSLWALSRVYGVGASKYEERNWEKGYEFSKGYAALMRHANQFWNREDLDEETKCHHMACVAFHAFSLIHFSTNEKYKQFDNRPEQSKLNNDNTN